MSEKLPTIAAEPEDCLVDEPSEANQILTALRTLYKKVTSPVIRACLEAAHADIAYLTDRGDGMEGLEDEDLHAELEGTA